MSAKKVSSQRIEIDYGNYHQMVVQVINISHITRHGIDLLCKGSGGIDPVVIIDDSNIVQSFRNSGIKAGDMILVKCSMHNHKLDGYYFKAFNFKKVNNQRGRYSLHETQ